MFIGASMERERIEAQLDIALLTDEEMARYAANWAGSADPAHPAA